jgi:PAS domain S-box-containing protein
MNPANDVRSRSVPPGEYPLRPAVLAVLVGLALSLTSFSFIRQNERQHAELEFGQSVENHRRVIGSELDKYEGVLFSLRDLFVYGAGLDRQGFSKVAHELRSRHPGIRAIEWLPRVLDAERDAFEAAVRGTGQAGYSIKDVDAQGGEKPAARREEYFPVLYVEPLAGNEPELGGDGIFEATRAAGLGHARATGEQALSGRIPLAGAPNHPTRMILVQPVYRRPASLAEGSAGREELQGYLQVILHVDEVAEATFQTLRGSGVEALILDNTARGTNRFLYFYSANKSADTKPPAEGAFRGGTHREVKLPLPGRELLLLFRPAPAWLEAQASWNRYGALISGLSFTLLLVAYLLAAARRAETVAALVIKRTTELQESNARLQEEIQERQNAARASGRSAVLLRATLEATGDGILVVSADGKIESYNHRFRQMWGLPEEILAAGNDGQAVNYVLDQLKTPAAFLDKVREVYAQTETASFDVLELKDGRVFERYSQPQIIEGAPVGRVWSFRDVTERQRAAEALRRSEEQLRNLVETSQDLIWSVDAEGRWVFINGAARRIYGYEPAELLGHRFTELQSPEQAQKDLAVFARIKAGENFFRYETEHRRKDGTPVMLSFNAIVQRDAQGRVLGTTGTAADITERKQVEAEQLLLNRKLLETQKLESLGVLAGGIAHDFNNLLTGILGNASLARMDLPEQSPLQPLLEQVEISSLRAADLCKQMLAYSGKGRFQVQPLNLNALVEETTELLHISIAKKAALRLELQRDLPAVTADSAQLHQVIMNLVINASEAIGDHPGMITLRTGTVRVDRDFLRQTHLAADLATGDYVCLEVSDNGCGMTAEIQARMFDPFFTTKFTGRGLGLAAVLGIVHGHQGGLKVYSAPGQGTRFTILLPRARDLVPGGGTPATAAPVWHGSGTVLVVDDEPSVREVAALVLKAAGFKIVLAADGAAGVAKFRETPTEFVAVLMDLTMPQLDGVEAFCEIRKIRPDTKVLLMSGFNEHDAISRFTGQGLAGFIQKPFKIATLRDKLREILEGTAVSPPRA